VGGMSTGTATLAAAVVALWVVVHLVTQVASRPPLGTGWTIVIGVALTTVLLLAHPAGARSPRGARGPIRPADAGGPGTRARADRATLAAARCPREAPPAEGPTMLTTRPRLLLLALVLVLPGLLAACGGEEVDTSVTVGEPTELPPVPTELDDREDISADIDLAVGEDCIEALEAFSEMQVAQAESSAAALSGSMDFAALERDLQELAEAAPAEIRSAFETYSDVLGGYLRELADIGLQPGDVPTQEQLQRLGTLAESLDQPALEEASRDIEAYFEEHCG
jgi:hypothetical protein